jgi:hypothetical protein
MVRSTVLQLQEPVRPCDGPPAYSSGWPCATTMEARSAAGGRPGPPPSPASRRPTSAGYLTPTALLLCYERETPLVMPTDAGTPHEDM